MITLGTIRPGRTIYLPFETFASSSGAPITMTGLAVGDIKAYKDGSTTERASTSGYTLLDTDGTDFDSITGIHGVSIDLSDNSTAGFWAAGSMYFVVVSTVTVDGQTMSFVLAHFRIGYDAAVLNTTLATVTTQTSMTLTMGPAEDDALNGAVVCIHDVASAVQQSFAIVADYTGSTKTVTLVAAPTFTVAASDNICFFPPALQPTVPGATTVVQTGDTFARIGANGVSLSAIPDLAGVTTLLARIVGTLATGTHQPQSGDAYARLGAPAGASVSADVAAVKTDTGTLTGRLTSTRAGNLDNLDAAVTSRLAPTTAGRTLDVAATGEAGLDFDNIKDATGAHTLTNITVPTVTSVTNGVTVSTNSDKTGYALTSAYDPAKTAAQAGDAMALTSGERTTLAGVIWDRLTSALTTAGSIGKLLVDNINATISSRLSTASYTTPPTVGAIADQVWDETLSEHLTSGSTGAALNAAGSAGDPWSIALPGSYGSGTAGNIVGNQLDAAVSSRATPAQVKTQADQALADVGVTTTVTGHMDVAVSTRLASSSYTAPLDAAGVRTAVGLAAGNLDMQLDAIPTNADLATALAASDGATLAAIAALNNLSAAQVNAEVVDALTVDTRAEPGQVAPPTTASIAAKIDYLYKAFRNRTTQTATTYKLYNDDGSTVGQQATVSDDGTTFERAEVGVGS